MAKAYPHLQQSIYLVLIVTALLRLLDDPLLLHRESPPQPRRSQLEPWLQARVGEYHPDPSTSDSNISMEDDQAFQTVANLLRLGGRRKDG